MTWTDARIAELTRLWRAGVSASAIAEALGDVSRSAVLGKLHRLKLLRSRKPASAPRRFEGTVRAAAAPPRPASASPGRASAPALGRSPWREAAFAPLPASAPRPWLTREFGECAFPVDGDGEALRSCCAPAQLRSAYCPAHHRIVFVTVAPGARTVEGRRWAEAAVRWAA